MKIIFYPPQSSSNDYINLIVSSLEKEAEVVNKKWHSDIQLVVGSLLTVLRYKRVVLHFNWIEDNATDESLNGRLKCYLLLIFMRLFHLIGGKLFWTMHNVKSHNATSDYQPNFIYKMLRNIDGVVIHSKQTIDILKNIYHYNEKKILYVPHGNFCKVMDPYISMPSEYSDSIHYLYFGSISEYKGVTKLIEAYRLFSNNRNTKLLICGKVNKEALKEKIVSLSVTLDSVSLDLSFIDNKKLGEYISWSDVIVLPYEKESMQNSGSAIMAFSCGKPVIIPEFGYINEIKDFPFVFSYDYCDKRTQILALETSLKTTYDLEVNSRGTLKQYGIAARKFAETQLDWKLIASKIVKKYEEAFGR